MIAYFTGHARLSALFCVLVAVSTAGCGQMPGSDFASFHTDNHDLCVAAQNSCTAAGSYNPATGSCSPGLPLPDGTPCDDHDACTVGDHCQAGACAPAGPLECTAANSCQTATCDPQSGCQKTDLGALCSATLQPQRLAGCWLSTYGLPVTIAGTTYNMQFDTGSNLTAVAYTDCPTCDGALPAYSVNANTQLLNPAGMGLHQGYGDGASWDGEVVSDIVQADGLVGPVRMGFSVITSTATTGTRRFFQHGNCDGQIVYNIFQGIVGAAGNPSPGFNNDNIMDALARAKKAPDALSLQLCERDGFAWFGGYDRKRMSADPQFVPMKVTDGTGFYTVALQDISVNGSSIALPAAREAILDSGTSTLALPQDVYTAAIAKISQDANFRTYFPPTMLDAVGTCGAPLVAATAKQLDAALPKLVISVASGSGAPLRLELPATHSYLQSLGSGSSLIYCSSLSVGSGFILGVPAHQPFVVTIDRSGKRVGFAPQVGCP